MEHRHRDVPYYANALEGGRLLLQIECTFIWIRGNDLLTPETTMFLLFGYRTIFYSAPSRT